MRETVLEWIRREKVIAIVRGVDSSLCMAVAEALYAGGIRLVEITYDLRHPESWAATAKAVGDVAQAYRGRMLAGAGTVVEPAQVDLTAQAGGAYIISPNTNETVIRRTRELGLVSIPGAMTPTEILAAHYAGADMVKLFPASELGTAYLKAIRGPVSQVDIVATGGINEKNARDYLDAGAAGLGVGGNLANKKWIETGDYGRITDTARALLQAVRG